MVYVTRHTLYATATTSGAGAQSFFTPDVINGQVEAIVYRRGSTAATTSGLSTGAKIVMTGEQTGIPVLTIATASGDAMYFYPRAYLQDTSGGVLGLTSAASPPGQPGLIPLAGERVKIVVTIFI